MPEVNLGDARSECGTQLAVDDFCTLHEHHDGPCAGAGPGTGEARQRWLDERLERCSRALEREMERRKGFAAFLDEIDEDVRTDMLWEFAEAVLDEADRA